MTTLQQAMLLMSFCISFGIFMAAVDFVITEIITAISKRRKERKKK